MNDIMSLNQKLSDSEKMPILFLGHGSPMNAIEENEFVQGFRNVSRQIPTPKAILCISAHWETPGTYITAMEKPRTIHDFVGFPPSLYEVQYPAHGSPELAIKLASEVKESDVKMDLNWGLDHGCWSVIKHLYPNAEVPVVQMSLNYHKTPKEHYELAKELASFRKKGVLIVGSGNIVHNLGLVAWDKLNLPEYGYDWAIEANERMKTSMLSHNHQELIDFKGQGIAFAKAIPTPDHYLPLLYVLGLHEKTDQISFFNDRVIGGSLSMLSVLIK